MSKKYDRQRVRELDESDALAVFRNDFGRILDEIIYLDGNSLGPLPKAAAELMEQTIGTEWGKGMIRSWNEGWFELPERLGEKLAPLVGAGHGQVIFADSVTVNFMKLATAAIKFQTGRNRIVTDDLNFPSNFYALEGLSGFSQGNHQIRHLSSPDGLSIPVSAYEAAIDENTALVTLSHVVFKSGFLQDLEKICQIAHRKGALVLADLSHSVGSVPVELDKWGVDLAVGCSYKYMNGGPGAPAFLYVRRDLLARLPLVLTGWFGSANPFTFPKTYSAANGIRRFLVGTPPILSMRAIEPGLDLLNKAGIGRLRKKSIQQGEFLLGLWEAFLQPLGFELGSPAASTCRGSHMSFRHPEASRINKAMIQPAGNTRPIIPDFRRPDNLRIGIAPLYLSFENIYDAVQRIQEIVQTQEYALFSHDNSPVT